MNMNFRFNPRDPESMRTCDSVITELKREGKSREEITNCLLECAVDGCDITYKEMFEKVRHRWSVIRQNMTPEQRAEFDANSNSANDNEPENGKEVFEMDCTGRATSEKMVSAEEVPSEQEMSKPSGKDELLKLHGFDPNLYTLTSYRTSKWDAPDPDGGIRQLCSSRISVAPKSSKNTSAEEIARAMVEAVNNKPRFFVKPKPPMTLDGDLCYVLPLADFHLDKRDPGNASGSFERQCERFYKIIGRHVAKIEQYKDKIGKIVFFWSQDFFNYDNYAETTTGGTPQDAGVGYDKMVAKGYILLIDAIETLRRYAPTEIFYTRSNHDSQTAMVVAAGLAARFRDDPYIIIDGANADERMTMWKSGNLLNTSPRKYVRWGTCLFGFGHGDMEGKRIQTIMQNEADRYFAHQYCLRKGIEFDPNGPIPYELFDDPNFDDRNAWSRTTVHIFFCGHFHSEKVIDANGVTVIYLPSDQTGDRWHQNSGYISASRISKGYLCHKNGDREVFSFMSNNL